MITSYKLQTLDFSNDINELICQIDSKISSIAISKLDNSRYGAKACIDYDVFHDLIVYKNILIKKAFNHKCFCEILIDDIISVIKSLLNKS